MVEENFQRLNNKLVYSLRDGLSLGIIIEINDISKTYKTSKNIYLDSYLEDENTGWTVDEDKIKKFQLIENEKNKKQEIILSNFYHRLEGAYVYSMNTGYNLGVILKIDAKSNKKYITDQNIYLNPDLENNNDYKKKGWTTNPSEIDQDRINQYELKKKEEYAAAAKKVEEVDETLNRPTLKDFLENYNGNSMTRQKYWIN